MLLVLFSLTAYHWFLAADIIFKNRIHMKWNFLHSCKFRLSGWSKVSSLVYNKARWSTDRKQNSHNPAERSPRQVTSYTLSMLTVDTYKWTFYALFKGRGMGTIKLPLTGSLLKGLLASTSKNCKHNLSYSKLPLSLLSNKLCGQANVRMEHWKLSEIDIIWRLLLSSHQNNAIMALDILQIIKLIKLR